MDVFGKLEQQETEAKNMLIKLVLEYLMFPHDGNRSRLLVALDCYRDSWMQRRAYP